MKYKNVQNFIRGIFEKDGTEARKADEFLTKLHNADIDITGRLKSRYGYEYWMDLLEENSITSSQNIPQVAVDPGDPKGFPARIQRILQYTDVAGAKYMLIVCQGKIYIETLEDNGRQWSCLTPNFQFETIDRHLDVVAYLDLLFFNDVANNIYYYDSQSYVKGQGWITFENRFIYFAEDTVYYRSYSDFSADFSIAIETGNPNNPEGQEIYDGLSAISYPYLANLKLGYCIRTGNDDIGYRYYVLDNSKNQRADNKCQIIKFNDRLIAQDYVEFDINADADILNFAFHVGDFEIDGNLYIMVDDGTIYSIDESNLDTELISNDAAFLTAPTNAAGKKQYSIAVNEEGIFVYTTTLPDKDDWYQPVMLHKMDFVSHYDNNELNNTFGQYPDFDQWSKNLTSAAVVNSNSVGMLKNHASGGYRNMVLKWNYRYWNYDSKSNVVYYMANEMQGDLELEDYLPVVSFRKTFADTDLINAKITTNTIGSPYWGLRKYRVDYVATVTATQTPYYVDPPGITIDFWFITDPYDIPLSKFQYAYWHYSSQNDWESPEKVTYTYASNELQREDDVFDLIDGDYNSDHFTSKTESLVLLLIGLNFDGTLHSREIETFDEGKKNWRFIIPSGVLSDLVNVMPIMINDNNVSFGNQFNDPTDAYTYQRGAYWNINISTLKKEFQKTHDVRSISNIEDDTRFLFYDVAADEYVVSADWAAQERITSYSDWNTSISDYNSNVVFHIYKQSVDVVGNNQVDKIQRLGTSSIPSVSLGYESPSNLTSGKRLKYYTAFQFYGGTTSPLSPQSFEITITNNTSKVVISDINHEDIHGFDIYDKNDIEKIQIYRSEIDVNDPTGEWSSPNLIATLEKDGAGVWYYNPISPPYAAETFEDSEDVYPYNPWTENNAIVYPVEDIFLHKNRLILVNKTNEDNSNVCMYSDVDRARAIPPANVRPIESGDGDRLIAGVSTGDYAYLFKESKIYGILGDFPAGQLVDISRTIGTRYKNLVTVYGGVAYFMNDYGVFRIQGPRPPENIISERLANYFDKKRDDCINFEHLEEHGFVKVDVENREIRWHVPQKRDGETEIRNNFIIKYNIEYDFFRTYSYYDNIYDEAYVQNIGTDEYEYLLATYEGDIITLGKNKADNNKPIEWIIRTKEFHLGTDVFRKIYKTIEVAGKYLKDIHVSYWIDGQRYEGELIERRNIRGLDSSQAKIWSAGRARRIMIEISGKQLNQPPTEIDEINIGYTVAKGSRF